MYDIGFTPLSLRQSESLRRSTCITRLLLFFAFFEHDLHNSSPFFFTDKHCVYNPLLRTIPEQHSLFIIPVQGSKQSTFNNPNSTRRISIKSNISFSDNILFDNILFDNILFDNIFLHYTTPHTTLYIQFIYYIPLFLPLIITLNSIHILVLVSTVECYQIAHLYMVAIVKVILNALLTHHGNITLFYVEF